LAGLISVSRAPRNALFELRLKVDKTVDLAIEYLYEKTHMFEQSEMLYVLFHRKLNFWAIFAFLQYFAHFGGQNTSRIERVK